MSLSAANLSLPDNFSGVARLFPLPNLVLFPGVIQPLHIFEPRYRQLMEDANAGDKLVTMGLLKPRWENCMSDYPAVHDMVCVGKVISHARLQDGRYNLLLLGAKRARIRRPLAADLPYQLAEVEIIEDPVVSADSVASVRKNVVDLFRRLVDQERQLDCESVEQLLCDELPFGILLDLIAFSTGAKPQALQRVLEAIQIPHRAELVLHLIESRLRDPVEEQEAFPPEFSYN